MLDVGLTVLEITEEEFVEVEEITIPVEEDKTKENSTDEEEALVIEPNVLDV